MGSFQIFNLGEGQTERKLTFFETRTIDRVIEFGTKWKQSNFGVYKVTITRRVLRSSLFIKALFSEIQGWFLVIDLVLLIQGIIFYLKHNETKKLVAGDRNQLDLLRAEKAIKALKKMKILSTC
jgi:hypothetical protein